MESRPIGASGIEVSALSLGSWRTFERIPRETGVAVMTAARERGMERDSVQREPRVGGARPASPRGQSSDEGSDREDAGHRFQQAHRDHSETIGK